MKLATFIKKNKKEISKEWEEYARENIDAAEKMTSKQVKDHVLQMLDRIAEDMETNQSQSEQKTKSRGNKVPGKQHDIAAQDHGEQRVEEGFDIVELSSEFRALRASVLRLWEKKDKSAADDAKLQDLIRFNEAIDEAWMHSLAKFHHKVDESKNWFLGTLGHDLRNPLAVISGVRQMLQISGNLSAKEKSLLRRVQGSTKNMQELIDNLLELTNLRLGSGMTIEKTTTDINRLCEEILQEFEVSYPDAEFQLDSPGPVEGDWDPLRLRQVINNLTANALRHGQPGGPVKLTVSAKGNTASLAINNQGPPIPEHLQEMIFNGMFSKKSKDRPVKKESSYGLGLYIVREIVNKHDGKIELESTEKKGTTFTICLPRN